ncbi:hypothetical protein TPR58_07565 [Sphingomonas sp. HF-S3]|uniref:DUF1444 family protein n=1 Tax=Sphingomonas rustica TaxID=3103142 RepID=A0ABV0B623_9SPHN
MKFLRKLFGSAKAEPAPAERAQDLFAQELLAALRTAAPGLAPTYDPEAFELQCPGAGKGQRIFLHNMYAQYCRTPETECGDLFGGFVGFILDSQAPLPAGNVALDALLPVLRARADLLVTMPEDVPFPYQNASRPFCETMLLMLAIDTPTTIALVNDETLAELGISFDDAIGLAIAQLDERGNHNFGQLGDGTFVTTCGDHYDASRILIPDLVAQLPVRGNPVAIVQARSAVLITGSEDPEGLATIADYALQDFADNERAISLTPIELIDGTWRLFAVEDHHPVSLRNLRSHQSLWSYGVTKDRLQARLGEEIFVANPLVFANASDGLHFTVASWADGVTTACPITDAIILQETEAFPSIRRRFDDVIHFLPDIVRAGDTDYPPRVILPAALDDDARRELTDDYPEFNPS